MNWELKPGEKASEAIQDWLNGDTIAECRSAIIALQVDAIRKLIGDKRFDELYSDVYGPPERKQLVISTNINETPLGDFLEEFQYGHDDEYKVTGLEKGDWGYVYNHPEYLLKHPAGVFQGENAIYMGDNSESPLWFFFANMGQPEEFKIKGTIETYSGKSFVIDNDTIIIHNLNSGDAKYLVVNVGPKGKLVIQNLHYGLLMNDSKPFPKTLDLEVIVAEDFKLDNLSPTDWLGSQGSSASNGTINFNQPKDHLSKGSMVKAKYKIIGAQRTMHKLVY